MIVRTGFNQTIFSVMARLLGLLLLLGLGWLLVKRLLGSQPANREPSQPRFEKTVRCARCGVHLPLALAHTNDSGQSVCAEPGCRAKDRGARESGQHNDQNNDHSNSHDSNHDARR